MQHRRLAAIMFTDIVGYTSLMGSDEDHAFEVLRKNRAIHTKYIHLFNGTLIKEMGDGMLLSFNLTSDAVRCAIEIQKSCLQAEIPLKIGIHEGEMVFEGSDVLGDGVNIASRIQENTDAGSITISESVYRDIKNKTHIRSEYLGKKRFKNVEGTIKTYRVLLAEKTGKSSETLYYKTKSKRTWLSVAIFIGILFAFSTVFFILQFFPFQKGMEVLETSIVVLPFENLGPDEQVYFTAGITEEITSLLASIKTLGVISRKSAVHYANTDKTIKQIGKELGVDYVLEGSVRWASSSNGTDKVRITPQLIRVLDDLHIWTENYDRHINDIFKIQSEIAQKVVSQLDITIGKGDKDVLEFQSTENLEAYQAYLRGRYYISFGHFSLHNWYLAIESFQQAIRLDSTFALAYAYLAMTHARIYNLRYDLTESRLTQSDLASAKALHFGPDKPGVHIAVGYYYLWAYRDYQKALNHFNIAQEDLPNNVEIMEAQAAIFEPQGKWKEYIQVLKKAEHLSPRDAAIPTNLAFGLWLTRQYEEAIQVCNQAINLAPNWDWPYLYKAFTYWSWKGANEDAREALTFVHPEHEFYLWSKYIQEMGDENFQAALELLKDTTSNWVSHKLWARPKQMMKAFIFQYLGEYELARENYNLAQNFLERKIEEHPEDPRYYSSLGIAYAGTNQKDKAIVAGIRATELLPMAKDAAYGIPYVQDLAVIYTMVGEFGLAMDQLEYLLSVPSWISPQWLKMDIRFSPLYTQPRFQKLISEFEK